MGKSLPKYVHRHSSGRYRASVARGRGEPRWYGPLRETPTEAALDAIRFRGVVDPAGGFSIADGFALLLRDLEQTGAREGTRDFYSKSYRYLTARLDPARSIAGLTPKDVHDYASRRTKEGASLSSAWKEIGLLQRIVRLAKQEGAIALDPLDGLRKPRIRQKRFGHLTAEQVAAIRATCLAPRKGASPKLQARDSALVGFLFGTGVRRAELARLRVRDVDFGTRTVSIDGKNADRRLPLEGMGLECALTLAEGRSPDQPLFGTVQGIERAFARICERSGVTVSPHRLRHSFATECVRRGVQPFVLSKLLGHTDVRMTMHYYHEAGDLAREAMRAVGGA
jgi:integrase